MGLGREEILARVRWYEQHQGERLLQRRSTSTGACVSVTALPHAGKLLCATTASTTILDVSQEDLEPSGIQIACQSPRADAGNQSEV